MKKVLIALSFVLATVCSYAANPVNLKHEFPSTKESSVHANSFSKNKTIGELKIENQFTCTVTITGNLGPSFANVFVSCSVTADDCASASSHAVGCVNSTITALKKLMK